MGGAGLHGGWLGVLRACGLGRQDKQQSGEGALCAHPVAQTFALFPVALSGALLTLYFVFLPLLFVCTWSAGTKGVAARGRGDIACSCQTDLVTGVLAAPREEACCAFEGRCCAKQDPQRSSGQSVGQFTAPPNLMLA